MAIVEQATATLGANSSLVQSARRMKAQDETINRRKDMMVGKQYSDFTAATLAGDSLRLSDVATKNRYTFAAVLGILVCSLQKGNSFTEETLFNLSAETILHCFILTR